VAISDMISSIRFRKTAKAPKAGMAISKPATVVIRAE
jgi:hypothetical protein